MRIMSLLKAGCLSLMLSACVAAPLLMMSPTNPLMWALLKPLVGFDPNEVNLLEQPLIKDKMTAILGPNYDTTVQLLKTANELQQEGPLFYLVSRYAPMPDVAKQAGMVWNSSTNQMAVMLLKGDGASQIFGENLTVAAPTWPSEMQGWQIQDNPTATALAGVNSALTGSADAALGNVLGTMEQEAVQAITAPARQVIDGTTATIPQQTGQAVANSAKQALDTTTATVQQQAGQAVANSAKQALDTATATVQQQTGQAVANNVELALDTATATVQQQADQVAIDTAKQAMSGAIQTVESQADKAIAESRPQSEQSRAEAEAELEKLLNGAN